MPLTKIDTGAIKDNAINSAKIADGTVVASDVLDNTITGAKLASDIAISTSGNITTTGAFTSTGIDDNATSTAITINSSQDVNMGSLGISNTSPVGQLHIHNFSGSDGFRLTRGTDITGVGMHMLSSSSTNFLSTYGDLVLRTNTTGDGTNASERMRINSSGDVGIGTSSPSSKLHVNGNFTSTGIDDNATSTAITIDSSQRIGIGLTNPAYVLDIFAYQSSIKLKDSSNATNQCTVLATAGANTASLTLSRSGGNASIVTLQAEGNNGFLNFGNVMSVKQQSSSLAFETSSTERMRIDINGNVGIGTSSPNNYGNYKTLTLNGSTGGVVDFTNNGTLIGQIWNDSDKLNIQSVNTNPIVVRTGGSERMRITSTGNVGIGTNSPQGVLDLGNATLGRGIVWGGSGGGSHYGSIWSEYGSASIVVGAGLKGSTNNEDFIHPFTGTLGYAAIELDSFSDDGIKFYTAPDGARTAGTVATKNERMRIDTSGRVGIGTSSPISPLTVNSGSNNVGLFYGNTGNNYIEISDNNNTNKVSFGSLSGGNAYLYSGSGKYTAFYSGASERMRIDSSGTVNINTTEDYSSIAKLVVYDNVFDGDVALLIKNDRYNNSGATATLKFEQRTHSQQGNAGKIVSRRMGNYNETSASKSSALDFYTALSATDNLRMSIINDGNVGIGTSNPIGDLSIVDSTTSSGVEIQPEITTDTNRITNFDRADSSYKNFRLDALTQQFLISGSEKMRINTSGELLVGTTTAPNISGAIHVANSSGHGLQITNTSASKNRRIYINSSGNLYFWNGTNEGYLSDAGAWTNASDERLKKNIRNIEYGLNTVLSTQPRHYERNDVEGTYIGFVAQELQKIVPEVVSGNPDKQLGVDYGSLVAISFKAIQEQQTIIEELKARITALENN